MLTTISEAMEEDDISYHGLMENITKLNVTQMALEYDIVTAKAEDTFRIADFLVHNLYKEEPLNKSLSIPGVPASEMFCLQCIPQGVSYLAISRTDGRILGVCINRTEKTGEEPPSRNNIPFTHEGNRKFEEIMEILEGTVDVWKTTGADSAWYIQVLAVDAATTRRGIGRALMEHTRQKARAAGVPMIYVICTSYFSAKIARNMGMKTVYSLPFSEYKGKDGQPVFKPPHPHTEAVIFVQKLQF